MADLNKTGYNPTTINRPRSVFRYNKRHITTIRVGDLVPIQCEEVLPGDTWHIDNVASVIKAALPFVTPVYGDLTLSLEAFFVPMRLVWEHWFQFCGQNEDGAWTETNNYLIPKQIYELKELDKNALGTLADYFGLPLFLKASTSDEEQDYPAINELPLRAYARIWNEYYRNENTDAPILVNYGDDTTRTAIAWMDKPKKASRFHDYFSNCLPAPQKGPSVNLPVSTGMLPLKTTSDNIGLYASGDKALYVRTDANENKLTSNTALNLGAGQTIKGLAADASAQLVGTINQLRLAAQTQVFYETCARFGTRYNELTYGLFGVDTGDTRAYRCEHLGGVNIPLNFQEVVATSSSEGQAGSEYALGQQTVKSATADLSSLYLKSATEHGYVMIMATIRYQHQYCQGIERKWKRNTFLDFYNPIFDNLGETPVMASEIYALGNIGNNDLSQGQVEFTEKPNVFGYQEAWAEYRYWPDYVTGGMRPGDFTNSLPTMTFADNYSQTPTLNGFMAEQRENVQRTFALTDYAFDFMCDFVINGKVARPMSVRSIPGLTDHHGI